MHTASAEAWPHTRQWRAGAHTLHASEGALHASGSSAAPATAVGEGARVEEQGRFDERAADDSEEKGELVPQADDGWLRTRGRRERPRAVG